MPENGVKFPIPSVRERKQHGRSLRQVLARTAQGDWEPAADRNPLAVLARVNRHRFKALLPIKMGRMAASPFGFLRGAAPLMAADLAQWPTTGLIVQMCGDAHVANLGAFAAPDGHLVFDLNDFDESMPGPWEWDVKRMATSLVLAGRCAKESESGCKNAVRSFVGQYRDALTQYSKLCVFDLAKFEIRRRSQLPLVRRVLGKAERVTPQHLLEKYTELANGRPNRPVHPRIRLRPPLAYRRVAAGRSRDVVASLAEYRETLGPDRQLVFDAYHPVDVAFKVAGTGSVAFPATTPPSSFCMGKRQRHFDAIFLQVKEAQQEAGAGRRSWPHVRVPAHRGTACGRRASTVCTNAESDPLLGWTTIGDRHFLVRQLADHKARVDGRELHGARRPS